MRSFESTCTVCVCDNGLGIPKNQQDTVFEAYEQGRTDTPVSGSVGLGLNVSRQLARLMGGDLTYRYDDGVSTFALTLPTAEMADEVTPGIVGVLPG